VVVGAWLVAGAGVSKLSDSSGKMQQASQERLDGWGRYESPCNQPTAQEPNRASLWSSARRIRRPGIDGASAESLQAAAERRWKSLPIVGRARRAMHLLLPGQDSLTGG
jgi:hypothetical protein